MVDKWRERGNMKIVMLGAPGQGKGTQVERIAAEYGKFTHFRNIFITNFKNGTELGKKQEFMDKGVCP